MTTPTPYVTRAEGDAISLRPRDAAKALGISERTLWAWTKSGRIPHAKIGRTVLYPASQLRRWVEQQAATGA